MMHTDHMVTGQPTIARRTLGIRLRFHRERAHLNRSQAAEAIGYSPQTIQRIEDGMQATRRIQVKELGATYEIPADQMGELFGLALDGSKKGWWQSYKEGLPPDFPIFLETEQEASEIRVLETEYIPGLLQTPDYLVEVQHAQPPQPPEKARMVRELRQTRMDLLFSRKKLPTMTFLIGRAAIGYLDAMPPKVMAGQIERLREVGSMAKVEIRVITKPHAAMAGSFNILTPGPPVPSAPFGYIDSVDGCRYVEDPDVVSLYERTFDHVRQIAIPLEEYLT